MTKHIVRVLLIVVVIASAVLFYLSRPDKARLSVDAVSGKLPTIGKPRNQLIPTFDEAKAVGWPAGAKPTAAAGLQVAAFAAGLDHPRWLYVLPNGDVLVAETNGPPSSGGVTTWPGLS